MANPVLINDLRRSLFRRKPIHVTAYMAIGILVLTLIAASAIDFGMTYQIRDVPLWELPELLLPIVVPAFASGSFAREHEQRTWDDLRLTVLGSWEIIFGKFGACLLPTIVTIVVMFPPFAMLLMIQGVSWSADFGPWILIVVAKFLVNAFFYISLVMMCSCFFSKGRTALVASYVLLAVYAFANYLAWMVMVPSISMLFSGSDDDSGRYSAGYGSLGYHSASHYSLNPVDIACSIQAIGFGALCLIFLRERMRKRG